MKRKTIVCLIIIMNILISCDDQRKEYLNFEGYKTIGEFKNKSKEGIHISYYYNGKIRQICNYKNDKLEGDMVIIYEDSLKSRFKLNDNKLLSQVAINTNGDTVYSNFDNKIIRDYFINNGNPRVFYRIDNLKKVQEIKFDSSGNLISLLNPPFKFLTKKDSFDLDNAYPDWKQQIQEWEGR